MKALREEVIEIVKNEAEVGERNSFLEDVLQYGCVNGMVSALIYYNQTKAFYERHKEAINNFLGDTLSNLGFNCPVDIFGDKWDKKDPLALDTHNQNLLAWFAFEEVAENLLNEGYFDDEEEEEEE